MSSFHLDCVLFICEKIYEFFYDIIRGRVYMFEFPVSIITDGVPWLDQAAASRLTTYTILTRPACQPLVTLPYWLALYIKLTMAVVFPSGEQYSFGRWRLVRSPGYPPIRRWRLPGPQEPLDFGCWCWWVLDRLCDVDALDGRSFLAIGTVLSIQLSQFEWDLCISSNSIF